MTPTITLPKTKDAFSAYPEAMNQYFETNDIIIKTFPLEFSKIEETEFLEVKVTSADQYIEYIESEIDFWERNDPQKKLNSISKANLLTNAKNQFASALNSYKINSANSNNLLKQSVSSLATGVLYSRTKLANKILQILDQSSGFIQGFRVGLLDNKTTAVGPFAENFDGYIAALSYRGILKETVQLTQENAGTLVENIRLANENYSSLNATYIKAFKDQEERIKSIHLQTEQKLKELNNESIKHHEEAKKRFDSLEKTYNEHLKLEASAQYWKETDDEYTKKGRTWLGISIGFTVLIVAVLVVILALIPSIFSEDSHWLDVLKNSAIITVIASVLIYLLRIFVKLSMSSFHLSRDAKERNKLCHLFLALTKDGAVTDKERAIVLNALFSRSDTGLLKGDAGPTIPSGVSDIIDSLKK